jgi:hypothetical protein
MHKNVDAQEANRNPHLASHLASTSGRLTLDRVKEKEDPPEDSCVAFGYLRGLHERALAIEFRLRNGNRDYFSYSHLASWRYNPSVGLLLKFTDDLVTLVLIRGSNLDALVKQSVNLTDRGFQRHRILWLREMDEMELRRAGKGEPTIDRIEVAEFTSNEELQEWLAKNAPAFVRKGK